MAFCQYVTSGDDLSTCGLIAANYIIEANKRLFQLNSGFIMKI